MRVEDFLRDLGLEFKGYPEYVSVSQIGKWQKCPLSWLFNYASDAPPTFPERMIIGSAVHAGMEAASLIRMSGSRVDDSCLEVLAESANTCINRADTLQYPDVDMNYVSKQARKILSECSKVVNELPAPVFVEKSIEGIKLAGVPLVGYIDIVNEDNEVLDIKVGARHKTEVQANADLQLAVYAYAMETNKVGFVSVSSATGNTKLIRTQHDKSQIKCFIDYAEWVVNSMEAAKDSNSIYSFAPNPNGFWCNEGCSHGIYCPFSSLKNA